VAPRPLEAFFNPQRSWASLFRALLLPGDRKTLSGLPLRSCAFRQNPYGLAPALQRLAPTRKAVPLFARVFSSGRDRCSPELSDLSGSPSGDPWKGTSPSLPSPPVLSSSQPYDKGLNGPQGLADRRPGSLPITGRRPVWPFRSRIPSHPFKGSTRSGLFFHLEAPGISRPPGSFS